MAGATFRVTNPKAPRLVVAPGVRRLAHELADQAAQRTPRRTGAMAASWEVVPGSTDPATSVVVNTAPYARYVEHGTRFDPAQAPLGRAIAAGPR